MLVFLLSTIIIMVLVYLLLKQFFSPLKHLPNPEAWPIVNQLPYFVSNTDKLDIIERYCRMYKDEGAFRMTMNAFVGEAVFLTNFDDFKLIVSRPAIYERNNFFKRYFPLLGDGLLSATGRLHQFQKKLLLKAFSKLHLKNYTETFNQHSRVLVKIIKDFVKDSSRNVAVQEYFQMLAFDIIGQIGFGCNFNAQISKESKFISVFMSHVDGLANVKARLVLDLFPFLWYLPFGPAAKLKELNEEARNIMNQLFDKRKQAMKEGTLSEEEEKDILSLMINARDDETKEGMTDQLIKDLTYTFLLAAVDTTAISLAWCFLEFAKHPDAQRRARREIMQHLKQKSDITPEDISSLPFTQSFLKEALRCHPAGPLLERTSQEEVNVRGHTYPKGTSFILPIFFYGIENFKDGSKFQPDRFMDNEKNEFTPVEPFVFSYGPYSCIGKNFAMLEMQIAVAHLLRNFEFSVEPEYENYTRNLVATVMTDRPITLKVKRVAK